VRKKSVYTPPPPPKSVTSKPPKRWIAPLMVTLFLIGLAWIVVFYLTGGDWPISALGNWNLIVGFVFIGGGFAAATQWR
jgi:hypothetical protein